MAPTSATDGNGRRSSFSSQPAIAPTRTPGDQPAGGERVTPPAASRRAQEPLRQGLGGDRIVGGVQRLRQPAIVGDALGFFGARGEPRLHGETALGIEPAVGVGLQFRLGDVRLAHFTSFSFAAVDCPSIIARSFSRARDRRDITVPMGTSRVRATSS